MLREPVQTERGEVACGRCYKRESQDNGICPIDKEPCSGVVYRDKAKEKDVLALLCYCRFDSIGFLWIGELRCVDKHERECIFRSEKCQFCKETLPLSKIQSHLNICPTLISQGCPFYGCKFTFANCAEQLKYHLQENIVFHSHLQAKAQKELLIKISSIESTQQMLLIKEKEKENELVLIKEHNMEIKAFVQETSAKHHLLEKKYCCLRIK